MKNDETNKQEKKKKKKKKSDGMGPSDPNIRLNQHNQAHEREDLFMTDATCMVSSSPASTLAHVPGLDARGYVISFAVSGTKKHNL